MTLSLGADVCLLYGGQIVGECRLRAGIKLQMDSHKHLPGKVLIKTNIATNCSNIIMKWMKDDAQILRRDVKECSRSR